MKISDVYGEILKNESSDQETRKNVELGERNNDRTTLLEKKYEKFLDKTGENPPESTEEWYEAAEKCLPRVDHDSGDLYKFLESDWREELDIQPEDSPHGLYVSALINSLGEDEVVLPDLSDTDQVGTYLDKEIIVKGGVGDEFGYKMIGRAEIRGDAGDKLGENMEGGLIKVSGSAGDRTASGMKSGGILVAETGEYTGFGMKGGTLKLKSDTGDGTGSRMKDGKIIVQGDTGLAKENPKAVMDYSMQGGKIFVDGQIRNVRGKMIDSGQVFQSRVNGPELVYGEDE